METCFISEKGVFKCSVYYKHARVLISDYLFQSVIFDNMFQWSGVFVFLCLLDYL